MRETLTANVGGLLIGTEEKPMVLLNNTTDEQVSNILLCDEQGLNELPSASKLRLEVYYGEEVFLYTSKTEKLKIPIGRYQAYIDLEKGNSFYLIYLGERPLIEL